MNKANLILAALTALTLGLGGCSKAEETQAMKAEGAQAMKMEGDQAMKAEGAAKMKAEASIGKMSVDELATSLDKGQCAVLDANGAKTRREFGKIPSATLLTSYDEYALTELPAEKDKTLVFYCSNEECGASHAAAEKALLAGYTDVKILPAGIMGWKDAGKAVEAVQ